MFTVQSRIVSVCERLGEVSPWHPHIVAAITSARAIAHGLHFPPEHGEHEPSEQSPSPHGEHLPPLHLAFAAILATTFAFAFAFAAVTFALTADLIADLSFMVVNLSVTGFYFSSIFVTPRNW
jgi:hypothetical protein